MIDISQGETDADFPAAVSDIEIQNIKVIDKSDKRQAIGWPTGEHLRQCAAFVYKPAASIASCPDCNQTVSAGYSRKI